MRSTTPNRVAALACAFFLSLVAFAPAALAQAVPSPEEVLGFYMGQDGELADWAQIVDYYDRVGHASPMVRVDTLGTSTLGRPMIMAVVSSEENMNRIEEIRAMQARIADPRGTTTREREAMISGQPAIAFVGATLHGNEIIGTQFMVEYLHDLVTRPDMRAALDDVVMLLVPGMNPDGLDITRDWFYRVRGTEHARSPMPWLYHHYTGHDNNRDFFMITQEETRHVSRVLYEEWFPLLVWDVHQIGNTAERFFIPPFDDPMNPNIHPLLVRMTNVVGTQMALGLTREGKTGVSHARRFDLWWHGGGRTVPARHNMIGILSEAASVQYADPIFQDTADLNQPERGSMYPEPWEGGWWRARDIVEYELVAGRELVRLFAQQREDFVRNFTILARWQVRAGEGGGPFAWVFPPDQRDRLSEAELLDVLRRGGVEVHEATAPFEADGVGYPAGTRVVLMGQPFRAHAKDLLEPQEYPHREQWPDGPPDVPYDMAGWTLPYQMGVNAIEVETPFPVGGLRQPGSIAPHAGTVRGSGMAYALDPRTNASNRAVHEIVGAGGSVSFADAPTTDHGADFPAGAPVVWGLADLDERVGRWAREWGLDATALPTLPHEDAGRLRVALYKPWVASIDEGWTRFIFESWEVPFDTIKDDQIRAGRLAEFDALVIPSMTARQITRGLDPERSPEEFAGGLGEDGVQAVRRFVADGGTLLLFDRASEFGIEAFELPVRNVTPPAVPSTSDAWYSPGSLLRAEWDVDHPIAAGLPAETAINYHRSPVFEIDDPAADIRVVARLPEDPERVLMSGYALGTEYVAGNPVLLDAGFGEGRVILFGFRPQHRAQPHVTFKPLFNSLLYRGP